MNKRIPGVEFFLLIFLLALGPGGAMAQEKFSVKEPALLTSAGQSADVQMVKVLLTRNKIANEMNPQADGDTFGDAKSVIIVIGGSAKGLGAAGLDADKEATRVQKILARIKEAKIPLIGMHIGGKAKRGDLSDRFIKMVAPQASYLLVVREGDHDGIFSQIASKNKIPISMVDKLAELQQPLKNLYGK
ncbi:MAG: hypothetical protein H6Q42_3687 [Deltaproteobacteria bacterium]|nr:hypothetical protein [Deltaproteobacteria bacterium]